MICPLKKKNTPLWGHPSFKSPPPLRNWMILQGRPAPPSKYPAREALRCLVNSLPLSIFALNEYDSQHSSTDWNLRTTASAKWTPKSTTRTTEFLSLPIRGKTCTSKKTKCLENLNWRNWSSKWLQVVMLRSHYPSKIKVTIARSGEGVLLAKNNLVHGEKI